MTSETFTAPTATATANTCIVNTMQCGTPLRMCTTADCYTPAPTTTPVNARRRLEPATTATASVTTDARATNTRVISFKSIGLE
jgi:hypothetical protein